MADKSGVGLNGFFNALNVALEEVDRFVDLLHLRTEALHKRMIEGRGNIGAAENRCAIGQYRVGIRPNQAVIDARLGMHGCGSERSGFEEVHVTAVASKTHDTDHGHGDRSEEQTPDDAGAIGG